MNAPDDNSLELHKLHIGSAQTQSMLLRILHQSVNYNSTCRARNKNPPVKHIHQPLQHALALLSLRHA
jgi:hypothetical protein